MVMYLNVVLVMFAGCIVVLYIRAMSKYNAHYRGYCMTGAVYLSVFSSTQTT